MRESSGIEKIVINFRELYLKQGIRKPFNVTSLAGLMGKKGCGVNILFSSIMGIGEFKEPNFEPEPVERGEYVHQFLKEFWEKRTGRFIEFNNDFKKELFEEFEEFEKKEQKISKIPLVYREIMRFHIENIARLFEREFRGKYAVADIEKSLECEFEIEGIRVMVSGRVDLVLRSGNTFFIIDYKTGTPSTEQHDNVDEWQLKLYAYLYSIKKIDEGNGKNLKFRCFAFYSKRRSVRKVDPVNLVEVRRKFEKLMKEIFNEDGFVFSFSFNMCYMCAYRNLCEFLVRR